MPAPVLFLLASAVAVPPTFHAADPSDVEVAEASWRAAAACTGREGRAFERVPIERDLEGPLMGQATVDDHRGMRTIRLRPDAPAIVLAHEVAHAWFHRGAAAFVEGRAELLAECIAKRLPEQVPFLRHDWEDLEEMPDLREWEGTAQSEISDEAVAAAYAGSMRLFRAIGEVVPHDALWSEDVNDWPAVEKLLERAGPAGTEILEVVRGGATVQREALADTDLDGLTWLQEQIGGTDPDRWDSDGDGWWDGAPVHRPEGALPVPRDGTPLCPARRSAAGPIPMVFGGDLRGHDLHSLDHSVDEHAPNIFVTPRAKKRPGGYWMVVAGQDLVDNPWCACSVRATLRVIDAGGEPHLHAFASAIESALDRADVVLGRPPLRLLVDIRGSDMVVVSSRSPTGASPPRIWIPVADLRWASRKPQRMAALADQTVALHRVAAAGGELRDPAAGVALMRTLAQLPDEASGRGAGDKPPNRRLVEASPKDVRRWSERARVCAEGWVGLLAGYLSVAPRSPLRPTGISPVVPPARWARQRRLHARSPRRCPGSTTLVGWSVDSGPRHGGNEP